MKPLLFFLLTSPVFAQYQAAVKPDQKSGYQRIDLSPDILGRLNDGLGNIRLYDGQRREVPYLLTRQTGSDGKAFVPFTIISTTSVAHAGTTLIVKRPNQQPIQTVSLAVKNTAVQKSAMLSGSPDGNVWYALDNNVVLGGKSSSTSTAYTETLSFPLTDYPYFRLQISDSTSAPLNILRVGSYGQITASAQYTPVPDLRFTQRDSSDHYTYLFLSRSSPARIDRLMVRVNSPAQYHRGAELGQLTPLVISRKRKRSQIGQAFSTEARFVVSSTGDSVLNLPSVLTEKRCIRIANADDPPLQIRAIEAAQMRTYLVANLLANSTYTLEFGDKQLAAPVYDLTQFKANIPAVLPAATVGPMTAPDALVQKPSRKISPYMLWLAIGTVLAFLGYMSYQMLGNINERKDSTKNG